MASAVRDAVTFDVGVNAHKNDAEGALAGAVSCGASFVRVKVLVGAVVGPEGIGRGERRTRARHAARVRGGIEIWADLYELTSWPLATTSIENLADLATRFGSADRLIVTDPTVEASRAAVATGPHGLAAAVLIGGRTTAENIGEALAEGRRCDRRDLPSVTVEDGPALDLEAVEGFMGPFGRLDGRPAERTERAARIRSVKRAPVGERRRPLTRR